MGMKKLPKGPSLPKSILEHIDREDSGRPRNSKGKNTNARKDTRKQERFDRKKRRADHFSSTVTSKRKADVIDTTPPLDVPASKRIKKVRFADDVERPRPALTAASASVSKLKSKDGGRTRAGGLPADMLQSDAPKQTALEKLALQSTRRSSKIAPTSRVPRTREEVEDDAYIAYLEAKLGYANGTKRRQGDEEDGLGDLLDFADTLEGSLLEPPQDRNDSKYMPEFSEVDEAWDVPTQSSPSDVEAVGTDSDDGWTGFSGNDDEPQHHHASGDIDAKESEVQSVGRYVPPGLRKEESKGEDVVKLTRQLKGLINRMSEQNMSTMLNAVEEVYRKHRRHDVTSTLTDLIINGISSHAMLLDSFVVLHAAFIASLHRLIGVEFVAFIVQNIVLSYERHLREYEGDVVDMATQSEDRGKECSNLLVLLSELYNFQVISCILLYDIIKDLLSRTLTEFRVELLLKILRSSGQQLRQDDPLALKDIVTLAQSGIADQCDNLSSRTKFMIETLTNLKNNKTKKSGTQHQGGDAVERMKKFLSGLGKKRHVQAREALRVSLSDLRSSETKGKWWLVGAAWGGDPLSDHQQRGISTQPNETGEPVGTEDVGNTALAELARKQGMNTAVRRSIFVILMSSDDYLDACDRLAQLNLSEVQQREIVRVILHCCGNEKSYNPYYALVCQHLCQRSHAYRITLQFCLWDILRDLGETSVGGAEVIKNLKDSDNGWFDVKTMSSSRMRNIAKAYGWWIAKDCCAISILKPIDFTVLKVQSRTFLEELFVQVFAASQTSSPALTDSADEQMSRNQGSVEEIFSKATKVENLGLGLIFFLSNTFRGEEGLTKWASGVAREALQTGMHEIPRL